MGVYGGWAPSVQDVFSSGSPEWGWMREADKGPVGESHNPSPLRAWEQEELCRVLNNEWGRASRLPSKGCGGGLCSLRLGTVRASGSRPLQCEAQAQGEKWVPIFKPHNGSLCVDWAATGAQLLAWPSALPPTFSYSSSSWPDAWIPGQHRGRLRALGTRSFTKEQGLATLCS